MPEQTATPSTTKKSNKALIIILIIVGILAFCGIASTVGAGLLGGAVLKKMGIDYDPRKGVTSLKTDDGTLTFDEDGQKGTIKTEQGEFQYGENLSLPSDFPTSIPIYPNAKITAVSSKTEGNGSFVTFTVKATTADVFEYYKTELPKNGWTKDSELSGLMLTYKKDGEFLGLSIAQAENGDVGVVMSTSKEK